MFYHVLYIRNTLSKCSYDLNLPTCIRCVQSSIRKLCKASERPKLSDEYGGQMNFRRSNDDKFQKRYFLLKGNLLFYFTKKTDRIPVGLIIIEGYTVELSNEEDGYCFQLVRRSNGSVIAASTFVVGTAETLQSWLLALTNCSYEQMKISAERMTELATTSDQRKSHSTRPQDQNGDEMPNSGSEDNAAAREATFEDLHETYGNRIKEMLTVSKG